MSAQPKLFHSTRYRSTWVPAYSVEHVRPSARQTRSTFLTIITSRRKGGIRSTRSMANPFRIGLNIRGFGSEIEDIFGGSLKLRQVSAGGCNGCELELGACSNVNFDMARYGIEFVASPRHADGIVLTGPLTRNMLGPFLTCYEAVPDPKMVIMTGACSISGGVFANSPAVARGSIDDISIDLFVPGCPPHPLTFITGVLRFVRRHGKRR